MGKTDVNTLIALAEEKAARIFRDYAATDGRKKGIWPAARQAYMPLLADEMGWKNETAAYHHAHTFYQSNRWKEGAEEKPTELQTESPAATVNKAGMTVKGNTATLTYLTANSAIRTKTLDQLLDVCGVDRTVWKVRNYDINKWDQAAMPRSVGRSKNWRRNSTEPIITELFQVSASLERIVPEPVLFPEVQPVHVSIPKRTVVRTRPQSQLKKAIILPDVQCGFRRDHRTGALEPFHDRTALDVALQIIAHRQPDRVVLLGDNLDLPEFSDKFVKSPEFYFTTQPTVAEFAWWLGQIRSVVGPSVPIDWIEGNHDRRFLLSVINHNIASYDLRPADDLNGPALMSVERLCGLSKHDITYHASYPAGEVWINDNLRAHHGTVVRSKSGSTTRAIVEDARHSEIQGHIHRFEMATKTGWTRKGPRTYVAFSPGTLARLDPGAVPSGQHRNNWQQGLGEVEYEEGNGYFNIYPIQIHSGAAIYDGIRWESQSERDIVEQIESDLRVIKVH